MNKIEKQFKEDFEKSQKVELTFDTSKLEQDPTHVRHKVRKRWVLIPAISGGIVCSLVLGVSIAVYNSFASDSVKEFKRQYTVQEIKIAENNTFKKLNNVKYPNNSYAERSEMSQEEKSAYDNFASETYQSLFKSETTANTSYSLVNLYSVLNELEGAASLPSVESKLNSILGLNRTQRKGFYSKVIKANSFGDENATTQIKNSAFFNYGLEYNPDYVSFLQDLYCEAYQISFSKDANKMVEWVNKATNSSNFIDKDFLELKDDTVLYLFSTMYFKHNWSNKYLSQNNTKAPFYLADGKEVKATFMEHTYFIDNYFDYGSYISFKDYYYGGNSITYLIPKKLEDNIYDLTKDVNIFEEKEANVVNSDNFGRIKVELKTPKFSNKSDVDFKECLYNLGLGDIYNPEIDSFHGAFTGEKAELYSFYLQTLKSRSEVEFNEDGTTVKNVTMGGMGGNTAINPHFDTLEVNLNQPFIYIIRDINDMPIFVGHVDNPNAK